MKDVYVIAGKRTPIGNFLGTIKDIEATDMGAEVVKDLINTAGLSPDNIDELICGNVLQAGVGQGPGRQVAIKAGLPEEKCGYAINMVCGSGLKTVMIAAAEIGAGINDIVIAGGAESMSNSVYMLPKNARSGMKFGNASLTDHMIYDALTDAYSGIHMGITAENIAEKYNITRKEQDEFAINSQTKAIKAVDEGKFKEEITPLSVKIKKDTVTFDTDEYPNRKTTLDKLSSLRPAFKKDGTVTAGNASGINDGASFVLLASEDAVKKHNLKPIAKIVAFGQGGVDPNVMGLGPTVAIKNALNRANMSLKDIDLLELNEAFAAQSLGVVKELAKEYSISEDEIKEKTNVNGGAIALGHPVGASGNRILVTLLHEMKKGNNKYGLASLCIGGGMGVCVVVEKV